MKISRLISKFNYGDWEIHKYGVDNSGRPVHSVSDFRDWFYFRADQIGQLSRFNKIDIDVETVYKSVFGEDCYKVTYTSIKEKNQIVKAFPEYVYESDLKPEFKWLMQQKNVEWSDHHERNIGFFDIETFTESEEFSGPDNPFAPITSIQIYTTRQKKYFMFAWHETETEDLTVPQMVVKDDVVYVFCKDEIDVILSFFEFIKEYKVDIIAGWYSKGFDLPYICERCDRLNINYRALSPINSVNHYKKGFEWKTFIDGMDHIDMIEAVWEVGYRLPNNKLATAAKEILQDPDVEKLTEVTWRDWKDNFAGFMKYGLRDVEILKRIDEELGIMDLFCVVQKLTNITQLLDMHFKTSVVDKFIISDCRDKYVFPTRRTVPKEQFSGAIVLDPKAGLHKDVALVDYASLYPTTTMSFNLSPETFICSHTQCEKMGLNIDDVVKHLDKKGIKYVDTGYSDELVGKRYLFYAHESKVGVVSHVTKKMYEERKRIKKEMKSLSYDDPHYKALDKHQYALKIILNSVYGAIGFNVYRLYKLETADATTFFARRALQYVVDNVSKSGFEVVYGDTDSCFFKEEGENGKFTYDWVKEFNKKLDSEFVPHYNKGPLDEYMMMELELEGVFRSIYFSDSKKRYYAINRDTGKKYIRGINIRRKDAPAFLRVKLEQLVETMIEGDFSMEMLLDLKNEILSQPYESIGVTKSFGKPFDQFKTKVNHVEGAKFANKILGCNITHKDTPLLFFIKSKCENDLKPKERHKTICIPLDELDLIDKRTDLFEIDYETYFDKQVIQQLKEFSHIEKVKEVLEEYNNKLKEMNNVSAI